jgi:hypothetical protein
VAGGLVPGAEVEVDVPPRPPNGPPVEAGAVVVGAVEVDVEVVAPLGPPKPPEPPRPPNRPVVVAGAVAVVVVVGAVDFWPPRPPRLPNNPPGAEVVGALKKPDDVVAGPAVVEGVKLGPVVDGVVVEACVLGVVPVGLKLKGAFAGWVPGVLLLVVGALTPLNMLLVGFGGPVPPSPAEPKRPGVCAGFEVPNKPPEA